MSARISDSCGFNAPAEVGSGVLTDPNRIISWLTTVMRAEWIQADRVRVAGGSQLHQYAVVVIPDELRLHGRSLDASGSHGTARVADAPASGSQVARRANLPRATVDDRRLEELLADTTRSFAQLRHLAQRRAP